MPSLDRRVSIAAFSAGFTGSVALAIGLFVFVHTPTAQSGAPPTLAPGRVPGSARILTVAVTYPPGSEPPGSRPAKPVSVTITDLARVRQVSGLIDRLSLARPGEAWSCPAVTWGTVNLAFKTSANGQTLAAAGFDLSGCPGEIDLTSAGAKQVLSIPGDTFIRQVVRITGIPAPAWISAP